MKQPQYRNYAKFYDEKEGRNRYNWKYRDNPRESDKRLLTIIHSLACDRREVSLADLGCGNGNFLGHLKRIHPEWRLLGKDLAAHLIDLCRKDRALEGIRFEVGDLSDPPASDQRNCFDFVVLIAVLQVLPPEVLERAVNSLCQYLKPCGWLVNFDGYHPFSRHDLVHVEVHSPRLRPSLPTMSYFYPSYDRMTDLCQKAGFEQVKFEEFNIPFDLSADPENPGSTHTVQKADGSRFSMLGIVAQPWCFLTAQRSFTD